MLHLRFEYKQKMFELNLFILFFSCSHRVRQAAALVGAPFRRGSRLTFWSRLTESKKNLTSCNHNITSKFLKMANSYN